MMKLVRNLRRGAWLAALASVTIGMLGLPAFAQAPSGHIAGPRGMTGAAGPAGPNGADGKTWYSASGVPSSGTGANGDFAFRTDTAQFYAKAGGAWSAIFGPVLMPTGTLTDGNIAVLTPNGVKDSNVVLIKQLQARSVWANNGPAAGAPSDVTFLTLGDGTCAAPTYSFGADPATGIARATDSVLLCADGKIAAQISGGANAVNFPQTSAATTGNPVNFNAIGSDTNVSLQIGTKGPSSTLAFTINGVTKLNYGLSHGNAFTFSSNFFLDALSATPTGKQPLCIDPSTKQVYEGVAGAC